MTAHRAGQLLLGGVLVASVCLLAGLVLSLAGASASAGLMNAGLVILMATPVVRVMLSIVEYVAARDWPFAATASAVLAILLFSVWYSLRA